MKAKPKLLPIGATVHYRDRPEFLGVVVESWVSGLPGHDVSAIVLWQTGVRQAGKVGVNVFPSGRRLKLTEPLRAKLEELAEQLGETARKHLQRREEILRLLPAE
jgi:molybdopterin biosynthesis enzyme